MKYKTIVIDPPWRLNGLNPDDCQSFIEETLPYKTMSDMEIMDFKINAFADENCDLFLWTTKAKLQVAFKVLQAWGFHYENTLVWNKRAGLCHNGFHNISEFVLYGYRGKNNINFKKPISTIFTSLRTKHSEKPALFYSKIREVTQEPRIDIFARKRHYGFDAWGDQVEKDVEVP